MKTMTDFLSQDTAQDRPTDNVVFLLQKNQHQRLRQNQYLDKLVEVGVLLKLDMLLILIVFVMPADHHNQAMSK